ncbi:hypothetical protein RRG08_007963 [Elysia crispata]|uniref:Uncharacterized protein n=1 Tax=Elysia crispata TaxID=231223 RepID=A0AAE1DK06_9GAST|nr:hypothetical protein RRG08_007963 [Elysia crispata]
MCSKVASNVGDEVLVLLILRGGTHKNSPASSKPRPEKRCYQQNLKRRRTFHYLKACLTVMTWNAALKYTTIVIPFILIRSFRTLSSHSLSCFHTLKKLLYSDQCTILFFRDSNWSVMLGGEHAKRNGVDVHSVRIRQTCLQIRSTRVTLFMTSQKVWNAKKDNVELKNHPCTKIWI